MIVRKVLPAGTVVQLQGLPFKLRDEAIVEGQDTNFGLLQDELGSHLTLEDAPPRG